MFSKNESIFLLILFNLLGFFRERFFFVSEFEQRGISTEARCKEGRRGGGLVRMRRGTAVEGVEAAAIERRRDETTVVALVMVEPLKALDLERHGASEPHD